MKTSRNQSSDLLLSILVVVVILGASWAKTNPAQVGEWLSAAVQWISPPEPPRPDGPLDFLSLTR